MPFASPHAHVEIPTVRVSNYLFGAQGRDAEPTTRGTRS